MNCEYNLDAQIKVALQNRANEVAVSASLDDAVRQEVARARWQKTRVVKSSSLGLFGKKLLVAFCAVFCLSCCGVVAAVNGGGRGWVSHSGLDYRFDDFAQVETVIENIDFTPYYVENLAGGYDFQEGHISFSQWLDENGHRMSHVYKDLFMDYVNAQSGETVTLVASNAPRDDFDRAEQVIRRQVGEVELLYTTQPYKFVPVSYVLTEEDKAALADGSLEISVGTDEVERMLNISVNWTQEGVHYHLFGWDLSLTAEEMLDMAADFVAQTSAPELN